MINNKIFTRKLLSLMLLFCIVLCNSVSAQTESYIQTITGIIKPEAVCRVADEKFASKELWATVKSNTKVQNLVTFELRYDTSINFYSKPFSCQLVIDIEYKDSSNEEQKITDAKLSLQYDTTKGKAYKGIAYYKFAGGHDVTVTVKSISSKEFDVSKAGFFRIKNQILIDRTYKKREGNKTAVFFNKKVQPVSKTSSADASANLVFTDPSGSSRQMLFTWDPADFEYDKFDFEYTFYDTKSLLATQNFSTGIFDNNLLATAFKNNATRVSLDEPSYLLNMVFPKGYLLIRIRAYTYNVVDGENDREEGDWHYMADDGINSYAVYAVDEHEANLNWQYSAAFAEQGKRKEVVSYFDGGNKSRQSVTISNSDNVSIVAESVLDKQNRPAVSILPAPTDDNTIHFFRAFNRNSGGSVYSYADFNPDNNCVSNAQPMSSNFGSSRYYSNNNPWVNDAITKDVPSAEGYPFAVTEFTNDQTGRIRRQGGVGPAFQLGGGKETSYYYGKPAQEELDRLFGSEAGNAAHYAKNMVVDANGQVSVSYVDIAGKTVATALAGNVPGNVKALESQDGSAKTITDELVHPQGIVRDAANLKLSFNTTVMVPTAANYNFKYEFSGRSLELVFGWNPSKQVCADCYYDVKFSISDECGEPVMLTYNGGSYSSLLVPATFNYGNNVPNPNTACGTVLPTQIGNIMAAFPKTGEYKVSYELVMSRKALDFYMEYIKQANVTKTIDDYKKDYLKKIDLAGCFSDCKDCIQKLGSQAEFIERIKKVLLEVDNIVVTTDDLEWIILLYNETLHKCSDAVAKNCTITDGCAEYRKMMLKDVTPGGQYMLYDENTLLFKERGDNENAGTNAFLKAKADPSSPNVQINRNGVDMVVPIGTLQESELISNWQPEWAYLMLKYHPEKCLLDECQQQSASKNRDKDMLQTDDDIEASTKFGWNANNYTTFLNNEFTFISAPYDVNCIKTGINSKVNVFIPNVPVRENVGGTIVIHNRNVSLMEFLKYSIYCPDASKAPEDPNTHALPYINMAGIPTTIACPTPLAEWRLFRNLYIAIKEAAYRNPSCKSTGCNNCYIGVNVFSSMYSPKADPLYYPQLKDFIIQVNAAGTGLEVKYDKETPINNRCNVYIHKAVNSGGVVTSTLVFKAQYLEGGTSTFAIPGANVDDKDLYFVEHIINNYNHNIDGTVPATNCPKRSDFLLTLPTNKILNITYTGKYPILNPVSLRVHWTTYHCWPHNGENRYQDMVYNPLESGLKNVNNNSANTCRTENEDIVSANYCTSTPSSCISDSRWPSYFQKTRRFYESSTTDDINTVLQNANGGEPLGGNSSGNGNDYHQNAEDLSAGWMEKLKGCANPGDPGDAARREELRQRLMAVCIAGSDQMHPYGSSTTKPNTTTSYGDKSFKDAIMWYLGGAETPTCNAYAIDFPLPYGDNTLLNDDIANKLTACGYNLLTRFKTEWLAVAGPSGNTLYPNLATYIKKNYDPNFYLTDSQIADLITSYTSGCPLKRPIRIPGILTRCDNPATPTCLKCGQLYSIQVRFQAAYPQFPVTLSNYYELLAGYINEQYQMNVSPTAVYTAIEKCKMGTTFNDDCTTNQCPKVITALQRFYQVMPLSEYTNKITCDPLNCSTIVATFRQHITTWLNLNLGWNKDFNFYSTNYLSSCAAAYYQEPSCSRMESRPGPGNPCVCPVTTITCCTNYQPFTTFRSLYPNPVDPRILAFFFELRRYALCAPVNLPDISYQSSYATLVNYFTNLVPGLIPYCSDTTILTKEGKTTAANKGTTKINVDDSDHITNLCATIISGNVWHDVNGMTDGYVNNSGAAATPPAINIPGGLYAYLVNSASLTIQKLAAVNSSTGVFSFGQIVCNTNYKIYISNVIANIGDPAPATTLPLNWIHTGQQTGTGAGDDGTNDGILALPYGFSSNANFGIKYSSDPGPDPEDTTTTVSGNVWGDVNGMTDGYVNNTSSWGTMGQNTIIPAGLRAYLLVPASVGSFVADVSLVDPLTGAYSFINVGAGAYAVRISALVVGIGAPYPAAVLPASWIHTGQHLGSGAGDDGLNDGSLDIIAGASPVTGVNFGIRNNAPTNTSCPLWTFTFAPVVATGCGSIYDTTFATNDFVLCSSPLTPVYQSDSNECIKNTVNAALANAEYAYSEYIKDFMRDYREAYFAKCMSITPSLLMTGQQQEYHYTLYYYDQSGNLVKTIPPKGVNYLNDTEVQETGRLRDEDNGDCYKNSTAPIFSNTATHQVTVDASKYPSHKGGPLTIESWVKFDNTTTRQMIVNQFDDAGSAGKAGYYAYIDGGKLYFSIYGRSAETWVKKQIAWLYPGMLPNVRAHSYNTVISSLPRVRQFKAVCNTENLVTSNTGANNGFYHIVYQYSGDPADPAPVKIYVNGILQTLNWTATGNGVSNTFVDGLANVPTTQVPSIDEIKYEQVSVQTPFTTASATPLVMGAISRTVDGLTMQGVQGRMKHFRLYNAAPDAADLRRNSFEGCFLPSTKEGLVLWLPLNKAVSGYTEELQSGSEVPIVANWDAPATPQYPHHKLPTYYAYNSLNQVVHQETPDAGESNFWYDRLGRLVVSQNAEQNAASNSDPSGRYSYTLYDEQGRIAEVGEKIQAGNITGIDTKDPVALATWLASGTDRQVTQTIYDNPDPAVTTDAQILADQEHHFNSRKRVVTSLYKELKGLPSQYNYATHYVYDISGNVKRLYQENKELPNGHTVGVTKVLDYDFDLISGKVNNVWYQKDRQDQYLYRYYYDADNKVIKAESGRDELTLRTDSKYQYYKHGPLGRTELGHDVVQGVDYAYTLQGWLKGINGLRLDAPPADGTTGSADRYDMGRDGEGEERRGTNDHINIPVDVYAYTLGYYANDYTPINDRGGQHPISLAQFGFTDPAATADATGYQLFNGNIAYTTYANRKLTDPTALFGTEDLLPHTYSYQYDQLNRIVQMRNHNVFDPVHSDGWDYSTVIDDYAESISYDANGNIKTYKRNGPKSINLDMDDMTYVYKDEDKNNKLDHVLDAVGDGNYATEDIDNQNEDNYDYDKIGNLIKDDAEKITDIQWTVYGKIRSITKQDGSLIEYGYDPSGNRISKTVSSGRLTTTTYYYRDASGNVMAVYEQVDNNQWNWTEQDLYGSSRLGMWHPYIAMDGIIPDGYDETEVGSRSYELTNHLGNVMATVSDKIILVPGGLCGICPWLGPCGCGYYGAEVLTAQDYYPFGMAMPGRKFDTGSSYRYGFNGMEKDNDINGDENSYDFGSRIYDPRLGKFFSVDPLTSSTPSESPYDAFNNDPINNIDPDGESAIAVKRILGWLFGRRITVKATIYFYGDAATKENAKSIAGNIENRWNAAHGQRTINGKKYDVRFKIKGIRVSQARAEKIAANNGNNVRNNFIRVETTKDSPDPVSKNRSENNIGENSGYYVTTDNLLTGATPAHEFGHGFGLVHPADDPTDPTHGDQRGNGRPHIMNARGTLVDAPYTWNPALGATQIVTDPITGVQSTVNTMNGESREVTQKNIDDMLNKTDIDNKRKAKVGAATNLIYHQKNDTATPAVKNP